RVQRERRDPPRSAVARSAPAHSRRARRTGRIFVLTDRSGRRSAAEGRARRLDEIANDEGMAMSNRRTVSMTLSWIAGICACAYTHAAAAQADRATSRPNILLIIADDVGL